MTFPLRPRVAASLFALGAAALTPTVAIAADENLLVADNGEVRCTASQRDLTRFALKDDQFASVSKVSTGVPTEDFSVVNEPIRGDIYVSVPEGYSRRAISFFGTTRKGFVYKFLCAIAGDDAKQIFVANADLEKAQAPQASNPAASERDTAVRLVQAMYAQGTADGFEVRQRVLTPVNVGDLKVQMVAEYAGIALTGKSIKIENKGRKRADITEEMIAPADAVAVTISNPRLEPGQATMAYVVVPTGDPK